MATILFAIALPLLVITTGIRVLFSLPQVYDYAIDRYDAAAITGIPEAELKRANRELVRYFSDDRPLFELEVTDTQGNRAPLFTPEETAHLADVKSLLAKLYAMHLGLLAYVLAYVVGVYVWAREGSLRELADVVLGSVVLTFAALGALGALAVTGFGSFWERLHMLLFDNELWRLDPARHHLIQMFPEEFWFQMVVLLVVGTLVVMALLAVLALGYLWLGHRQGGWTAVTLPSPRPSPPPLPPGQMREEAPRHTP